MQKVLGWKSIVNSSSNLLLQSTCTIVHHSHSIIYNTLNYVTIWEENLPETCHFNPFLSIDKPRSNSPVVKNLAPCVAAFPFIPASLNAFLLQTCSTSSQRCIYQLCVSCVWLWVSLRFWICRLLFMPLVERKRHVMNFVPSTQFNVWPGPHTQTWKNTWSSEVSSSSSQGFLWRTLENIDRQDQINWQPQFCWIKMK